MSSTPINLNEYYIADLSGTVFYGGRDHRKVRDINPWKRIVSTSKSGSFIDLEKAVEEKTVWFFSDLHFGHKNIIKYCDRPFANTDEMDEQLVKNIQAVVGKNDILVIVGDIAFMETARANDLLGNCPGYKILIVGNHDFRKGKLRGLDFDEIHLCAQFSFKRITFVVTHYPLENIPWNCINIHGHVHNKSLNSPRYCNVSCEVLDYKPIKFMDLYNNVPKWTAEQIEQIAREAETLLTKMDEAKRAE